METQELTKGTKYGVAYENVTSVNALERLIHELAQYDIDDLLILPHRAGDDPSALATHLDTLSIDGFHGVIAISVLDVSHSDHALYACLNLCFALDYPELTLVVVLSSEAPAELAKVLALTGFHSLPGLHTKTKG